MYIYIHTHTHTHTHSLSLTHTHTNEQVFPSATPASVSPTAGHRALPCAIAAAPHAAAGAGLYAGYRHSVLVGFDVFAGKASSLLPLLGGGSPTTGGGGSACQPNAICAHPVPPTWRSRGRACVRACVCARLESARQRALLLGGDAASDFDDECWPKRERVRVRVCTPRVCGSACWRKAVCAWPV